MKRCDDGTGGHPSTAHTTVTPAHEQTGTQAAAGLQRAALTELPEG